MLSRIIAVTLGLIACITFFIFLDTHWSILNWADLKLDKLSALADSGSNPNRTDTMTALMSPLPRLAWTVCISVTAFAWAALIVLLIAGLIETSKVRRRLHALRYDPVIAESWNAADWRAVFTGTAIEDRAEVIIAAIVPMQNGVTRRIVVDSPLLAALDRIWLDRLTLTKTITPLPFLLLGLGATLALLGQGAAGEWEIALAAGTACALLIQSLHYLVRSVLTLSVALSVKAATAAMRPLVSVEATEVAAPPASAAPVDARTTDMEVVALALASALSGPMSRLVEAADRLSNTAQNREQAIDAAMAEVRAGIERLLAASAAPE